jgi:hypothetical protein
MEPSRSSRSRLVVFDCDDHWVARIQVLVAYSERVACEIHACVDELTQTRGDASTTQPAEPDLQEVTRPGNVAKSLQVTANPRRNNPTLSP